MSDDVGMFSAAAFKHDIKPPAKDHQMVDWRPLPSNDVLQALGRVAIRLSQLEHLLKLIYKRSDKNVSFDESLKLKISLGSLLNGTHGGKPVEFKGLIRIAESNPQLALVKDQLRQALDLSPTRRQYLHNGIATNSGGKFVGLDSPGEIEEAKMRDQLNAASTLAESLLSELNKKIPPHMSEE